MYTCSLPHNCHEITTSNSKNFAKNRLTWNLRDRTDCSITFMLPYFGKRKQVAYIKILVIFVFIREVAPVFIFYLTRPRLQCKKGRAARPGLFVTVNAQKGQMRGQKRPRPRPSPEVVSAAAAFSHCKRKQTQMRYQMRSPDPEIRMIIVTS